MRRVQRRDVSTRGVSEDLEWFGSYMGGKIEDRRKQELSRRQNEPIQSQGFFNAVRMWESWEVAL